MEGFGTTSHGRSIKFDFEARPVLLDSGGFLSTLTLDMTLYMLDHLDIYLDEKYGTLAPCDRGKANGTLDFTFGDLTINVPFKDFLLSPAHDIRGRC
jgi:hypothetical protein